MTQSILITGGSGYLGGTLLAHLTASNLVSKLNSKLFALVRTEEQAKYVKSLYSAEPLMVDLKDEAAIREAVVENQITIVFFLIDAMRSESQVYFLKALAAVKKDMGIHEVHFLHTSGAKIFSSHAGAPTDRPLYDDEDNLYKVQKEQKALLPLMNTAISTNNIVTEQGEALGVRTYIFVPCIVYGPGEGFGNKISIQTVAVVKAARAMRRVYSVDEGSPTWPVCHIHDNTTLYAQLLYEILSGEDPDSGRKGYYLASPGSVKWMDLYRSMAKALAKRGVIDSEHVTIAGEKELEGMAGAFGCSKDLVGLQLGGLCTFTPQHGGKIGWRPQYAPDHILCAADEEVELVLANL